LPAAQNEPYQWHVPVEDVLAHQRQALVIDLKPNNRSPLTSLSLYQLRDVWGFSAHGWTPGMMRLRGISVDGRPAVSDPKDFVVQFVPYHDSIYTFLQFDGTVQGGKLEGKWTAPRKSSTNSVLLWPGPLGYFIRQIHQVTPEAIGFGLSPAVSVLPESERMVGDTLGD